MAADAPKGRRYEIIGLLLLAVGLISIGGLLDWNVGFIGLYFAKFLRYLFGLGAWVASGVILLIGTQYVTRHRGIVYSTHFFGLVGLFISLLAILHHFLVPIGAEILPEYLPGAGGLLGGGLLFLIRKFFGATGSIILLCTGTVVAVLLSTTWSLAVGMLRTKRQARAGIVKAKDTFAVAQQKVTQAENIFEERVREKFKSSFYNQDKDESFDQVFASGNGNAALGEEMQTQTFPDFAVQEASVVARTQEEAEFLAALEPVVVNEESTASGVIETHTMEESMPENEAEEVRPTFSIEYASDEAEDVSAIVAEPPPEIPDDFDVVPLPADVPMATEVQDKRLAMMQSTASTQAMMATLPQERPQEAVTLQTEMPSQENSTISPSPPPASQADARGEAGVQPMERPYQLPLTADEIKKPFNLFITDESALYALRLRRTNGIKEHVALAQEFFCTAHIQDCARIDLGGNSKRYTRRNVCLDDASDDIDGRTLRREYEMYTRRARLLREATDSVFHIVRRNHHEIGKLIDDDDDGRHLFFRFCRIEALHIAHTRISKLGIAFFHLLH